MPYMRIDVAADTLEPALAQRLAEGATRLLADILRKRREVTVVRVVPVPAGLWFAAGAPLGQDGLAAFAEVRITRGTNTDAEKAWFLAEFQCLLTDSVGPLAAPVYTVIQEVANTDWGYDGLSQAERGGRP